jgi:hypothetical protein
MATSAYMSGRKQYQRPQAMLWSDTPGVLSGGSYVPSGYEVYQDLTIPPADIDDSFIILSDHNRGAIDFSTERIEQRKRMVNGTMRSYHIADKLTISTSWSNLPSRGFAFLADFNPADGIAPAQRTINGVSTSVEKYTVDGGAGGAELLKWYQDHKGPFWVFLSYDKYINFGIDDNAHLHLAQYSQVVQMYITGFDYNVVKRGGPGISTGSTFGGYDFWDVSVTLEEV